MFDVTGKSIDDLISMDAYEIRDLSTADLRRVVVRLDSAVNKRLKRFSPVDNQISPAIRSLAESMGTPEGQLPHMSVAEIEKGTAKERNQLHDQFVRAKNFLESKTSTAKGFKEYRAKIRDRIGNASIFSNRDLETAFWNGYNRFMLDQGMKVIWQSNAQTGYNKVLEWLRTQTQDMKSISADSIYELLRREYERRDIEQNEKFADIKNAKKGEIRATRRDNVNARRRSRRRTSRRSSRRSR